MKSWSMGLDTHWVSTEFDDVEGNSRGHPILVESQEVV